MFRGTRSSTGPISHLIPSLSLYMNVYVSCIAPIKGFQNHTGFDVCFFSPASCVTRGYSHMIRRRPKIGARGLIRGDSSRSTSITSRF